MKLTTLSPEDAIRRKRIGITGDSGSGKTHKLLEAMVWARSQVESADQLQFAFIDCDDGFRPLIARGLLPDELRPRIMYHLYAQDWNGIRDDTLEILPMLEENEKKNGPFASWLIFDNVAKAWDWLHDDYCVDVFGKNRAGMMRDARKRAMEEQKKAMPVLNQMLDYGVLNAEFFKWWDRLQFANINIIITSPAWLNRNDEDKSIIEDVNLKGVNPELIHRLDEVFWVHNPTKNSESEERLSSLIKRRTCSKKFTNVKDLSFINWMKWVDKYSLEKPLEIPE